MIYHVNNIYRIHQTLICLNSKNYFKVVSWVFFTSGKMPSICTSPRVITLSSYSHSYWVILKTIYLLSVFFSDATELQLVPVVLSPDEPYHDILLIIHLDIPMNQTIWQVKVLTTWHLQIRFSVVARLQSISVFLLPQEHAIFSNKHRSHRFPKISVCQLCLLSTLCWFNKRSQMSSWTRVIVDSFSH